MFCWVKWSDSESARFHDWSLPLGPPVAGFGATHGRAKNWKGDARLRLVNIEELSAVTDNEANDPECYFPPFDARGRSRS